MAARSSAWLACWGAGVSQRREFRGAHLSAAVEAPALRGPTLPYFLPWPGGVPPWPAALPELPGGVPPWPGALPELPGGVPPWPAALPELPGAVPLWPGAALLWPGAVLLWPGELPEWPGVLPANPGELEALPRPDPLSLDEISADGLPFSLFLPCPLFACSAAFLAFAAAVHGPTVSP